ncbi:hypothetical protein CC86DRAFT_442036 [Ophiobolus disseminans]|uniref:Cell division cycle protein 123 n=1 Tax=Ophiobolus disseminans TaxID=1469910 RepID=A0A6A7AM45_9PLEO|nr:hypothetical protein CC86DRAFT_442036 [Ophiobolus disseminans]
MDVRVVPFSLVAVDNTATKAIQDSSHPLSFPSQRFNTPTHSRSEIIPSVPERINFKHEAPPQNMTDSHVCNIPSFLYEDLMLLFTKWMTTGAIGSESLQDVIEAWTSTKAGKDLEAKLDGKFFWLIRLDQMSPKDSTLVRNGPISSFSDLVLKICSSMRAHGCFQHAKKDADDIGGNVTMQLILNPWDPEMDPAKEFRVFLVEINPFGAMSGCGACLFNWVSDKKMLYGLEKADFAVTLTS